MRSRLSHDIKPAVVSVDGPQPELADHDKSEERGAEKRDRAGLPGYGLGVEVLRLVPAGLGLYPVTSARPAGATAGAPAVYAPATTVGRFVFAAEPVTQALRRCPARSDSRCWRRDESSSSMEPKSNSRAGELVGGVGEVQGFVVLPATVLVREDGVCFLQLGELLGAAARLVWMTLLGELAISILDLTLGGVSGDAEYLIVVDLIRHKSSYSNLPGRSGPLLFVPSSISSLHQPIFFGLHVGCFDAAPFVPPHPRSGRAPTPRGPARAATGSSLRHRTSAGAALVGASGFRRRRSSCGVNRPGRVG